MVTHLSLGIACTALLCYLLRRRSPWWLYAAVILSVNPFFVRSTPPTAHCTILACITALFTLYLFEKKSALSSSFAVLGILGGLLLVSRFDIGLLLFASSVVFLWRFQYRGVLFAMLVALFIAYAGDPFLWSSPLQYFISVYEKINTHAVINKFSVASTVFDYFNLSIVLGTLSFLVGVAIVFLRPDSAPLPLPYLKGFISVTALAVGALTLSHHHPAWLFFPFSFMWELFLPLFILTLADNSLLRGNQARILLASIIFGHVAVLGSVIATFYSPPC